MALNPFLLRARHRDHRPSGLGKVKIPAEKIPLSPRSDDMKVGVTQYFISHLHLGRVWANKLWQEHQWFLDSMRGLLPPEDIPSKNWHVFHINLPERQYMLALEALTTRLGVKP